MNEKIKRIMDKTQREIKQKQLEFFLWSNTTDLQENNYLGTSVADLTDEQRDPLMAIRTAADTILKQNGSQPNTRFMSFNQYHGLITVAIAIYQVNPKAISLPMSLGEYNLRFEDVSKDVKRNVDRQIAKCNGDIDKLYDLYYYYVLV